MSGQDPHDGSRVVAQARADLAAGREWQAREALVTHLARAYDPPALELLGEVHETMRDLPAAGAAWFGTTRRGADVDTAIAAWRERYADDFPAMWRSLPRPVREHEGNARVDALRRRADAVTPAPATPRAEGGVEPGADDDSNGVDGAVVIAMILAALFVVFAVIGFIWVLTWIVPN
ncbi:hypothetical protein [Knoellia koreensis]|jgi:hypothetical protein|uniref:Uncharacterized protein n=1 Tax=Knoellia koreensis TaxID=2730921 RepID=A0A849HKY5_9MICO|nr:hypothetical protein [Knoellia sp. DB2414S]NNM47333.1 hypothetical protein [Knoellia sp. DB2414S]